MKKIFKHHTIGKALTAMAVLMVLVSTSFMMTYAESVDDAEYTGGENIVYEDAAAQEPEVEPVTEGFVEQPSSEEESSYEESADYTAYLYTSEPEQSEPALDYTEIVPENVDLWTIWSWVYLQDEQTGEYTYSSAEQNIEITRDDLGEYLGVEIFLAGMTPGSYAVSVQLTYDATDTWTQFIKSETVTIDVTESAYGKTVRIPFGSDIPQSYKKSGIYHVSVDVRSIKDDPAAVLNKYDYAYENKWDLRESYELLMDPAPEAIDTQKPEITENESLLEIYQNIDQEMADGSAGENIQNQSQPADPSVNAGPSPVAPQDQTASVSPGPLQEQNPEDTAQTDPAQEAVQTAPEQTQQTPATYFSPEVAYSGSFLDSAQTVVVGNSAGPSGLGEGGVLQTFSMSEGPGGAIGGGTIISVSGPPVPSSSTSTASSSSAGPASAKTTSALNNVSGPKVTGITKTGSPISNSTPTLKVLSTAGASSPMSASPVSGVTPSSTGSGSSLKVLSNTTGSSSGQPAEKAESAGTEAETETETRVPGGNPPHTDDSSPVLAYLIMAAAAAAVLIAASVALRKKREH